MTATGVSFSVMKSASISLIIGPRGLVCEANLWEIMGWGSFDVVRFYLGPHFKVKQGHPNSKVLITCLFLAAEVWDGKPTYRKSWAGNLFVVRFDLGALPQDQSRIAKRKHAYNSLIIGLKGLGW